MHLCLCDPQLGAVTGFTKICITACSYTFKLKKQLCIDLSHTYRKVHMS